MECLTLLLNETNNVHASKKFNIDAKDNKGMTPLHHAAIQKNDSYVVELIERFDIRKILYIQLFVINAFTKFMRKYFIVII